MRYKLAADAKPQLTLLLVATVATVALWFIPYAEWLVYPIRLFVTFIHESSHAIVALVTGGAVQSLTIASDGSGLTYTAGNGLLGSLFTSSAGYLGTTFFGVLMLYLMRRSRSSAGFALRLTLLPTPLFLFQPTAGRENADSAPSWARSHHYSVVSYWIKQV